MINRSSLMIGGFVTWTLAVHLFSYSQGQEVLENRIALAQAEHQQQQIKLASDALSELTTITISEVDLVHDFAALVQTETNLIVDDYGNSAQSMLTRQCFPASLVQDLNRQTFK